MFAMAASCRPLPSLFPAFPLNLYSKNLYSKRALVCKAFAIPSGSLLRSWFGDGKATSLGFPSAGEHVIPETLQEASEHPTAKTWPQQGSCRSLRNLPNQGVAFDKGMLSQIFPQYCQCLRVISA